MRIFAQKRKITQQTASAKSTIPGRAHFGQSREVNSMLQLQRTIGNQAVQRMLQTNAAELEVGLASTSSPRFAQAFSQIPLHPKSPADVQAKLTVGPPGDIYEEEAERVSEQVMRMPEPQLQPACPCGRGCPKCQAEQLGQERERLQTKRVQANDSAEIEVPLIVHDAVHSSGQPVDPTTREFMESRFGHDFSQVRVHTDETAAEAAHTLHANAFTVGSHIVFGERQFAPDTSKGRRLLAHELTHSVQQSAAGIHATGTIQRDENTEKEVKRVISPNVKLREEALSEAEGQLAKRVAKRKKEIGDLLEQIGPDPKTKAAKEKAQALKDDLAKDLETIIEKPDHPSVNKDLRKDIKQTAKLVSTQTLKLKRAQEQWSKFDPIFAGEEVAKALGTNSLSAAELKALIAQESGDLTKNDTKGDIAGIAQMSTEEEKRAGGAKGDRKKPEKAIPLAAKIMSLNADDLDKGLSVKPTGVERKKFIMGAFNGGVNLIVKAQEEAIKMKRDGKTWESLIKGGGKSPLFEALKKTYKADPNKPNKWADKYKEVTEYVAKIHARLP